jgi:hypothetical protein
MCHFAKPLALAGACILMAGCAGGHDSAAQKPLTTTTPTPAVKPLTHLVLPNLLLGSDQINAALGATQMAVTTTHFEMSDDSSTMQPPECLSIDGADQAPAYVGSGFTRSRDQTLQEGDAFAHYAHQAVVLFPSAKQAQAFYDASAQKWPACHHFTHIQSGTQWDVAPIFNINGMLSTTATQENAKVGGWACGRALTTRNNVVVDVNTCSGDPADSAVKIATQIAANVDNPPPPPASSTP